MDRDTGAIILADEKIIVIVILHREPDYRGGSARSRFQPFGAHKPYEAI